MLDHECSSGLAAALRAENLLLGDSEFIVGEGARLVQERKPLQFAGGIVGVRCRRRGAGGGGSA